MDKITIIKIGGNIIDEETQLASFLKQFAQIAGKKILVHGGGKLATRMADRLGIPQEMVEGRRLTDAATLQIVTMVYAGYINKNIVALLQQYPCNVLGICGADANIIKAHKRTSFEVDYGFAGDIDTVNVTMLVQLLQTTEALVIAPITHDGQGQLLNTNADTIAQELAKALSSVYATELVYCFEKPGVLSDVNDETSVIRVLQPAPYAQLKAKRKIFEGMIPKLDNAFSAVQAGVQAVHIGNATALDALIKGQCGTKIML
ncbi:acetylglutamate kinase [Taibaiella sp. KBW10]|uniref:acetylglutamate kinase n=1 Tax=Taibaiella sp. KBW10 TaxID=2153357 RepID=UPI000F5A93B7|nr:acetylglutamate kinase [Taibaiella sp. KBW10]RQO30878.1 acetylglutamate kinase [Taibaiella sp. KBW10]